MSDNQQKLERIFSDLRDFPTSIKRLFLETLLFNFTITSRAIHSDESQTEKEKLDALKWLNELTHRIWNIRSTLDEKQSDDCILRLDENLKFYAGMSNHLNNNLTATLFLTYETTKIIAEDRF
ncbi:hypothetical protein HHL16_08300 [Pseudoflavitalea sp. G-6-1-2]|uniref:hypothetical protein n=1 Tax=Pseudoflavitalea sp. G-6-1-2 TaxID=2728841 RepID=UPI00146AC5C6|nr:hypothetical protein [Pseudoflavitalea sp. G-6-1-2]NML20872.1 hypothetical protein [Pseudoflavitalea sp. G-6-1-2]